MTQQQLQARHPLAVGAGGFAHSSRRQCSSRSSSSGGLMRL